MNPLTNIPDQNQVNTLEVWANPEQKEQFNKNAKDFQEKYSQKLKNTTIQNPNKKTNGKESWK